MARSSGNGPGVAAGGAKQLPGTPSVDLTAELDQKDFMFEAGNTGLKIYGGYLVEEFDPNLRGLRGAKMFREMSDSSPTIGAFLYLINQVVMKLNWHLKPADQSPLSLLAAEFFESLIDDMEHSWDDFIDDVVSFVQYGYAPVEIVLKMRQGEQDDRRFSSEYDDGMVGVRKLAVRSQETILRWIMDPDNNDILGLVQMPWTGGMRMIPRTKFMLFRTKNTRNNPEGRSMLRNAYRPYYFAKRLEEIEGIGAERDLAGFPVIQIPAELISAGTKGTDPDAASTLRAYQDMVKNIKRNSQEGAILPSDTDEHGNLMFELKLLTSGGRRQFDTNIMIERYHAQMAMTVMADFLMLGRGGGSSRGGGAAAATDKIAMFYEAITALVKRICTTLNKELVPLIGKLNGIPKDNWPEFFTDKPEQVDLGRLGAFVNALAASGMTIFPNEPLEDYLFRVAGLPEPTDEVRQKQQELQSQAMQQDAMAGQEGQPGAGGEAGAAPPGAGNDPRKGSQGDFGQQSPGGKGPPKGNGPPKPGAPR